MVNTNTPEGPGSPIDLAVLIEVAEERRKTASELLKKSGELKENAEGFIETSRKRFRVAINHGGLQKVLELIESGIAVVGPLSYLLIAVSGLSYTWGFYRHFREINVLDYLDIPDFLLSAFSSPASLGVALVSLLVATFVLFLVYRRGMRWRARASTEVKRRWHKLTSMPVMTVGALIVTVVLSLLVGYLSGGNVTGPHNLVSVTSNNGKTFPRGEDEDSEYVALLGTTSNFHIFIECESSDTCLEGGVPFVVPSANVSTLEFRARDSHNDGTDPEPSDLLSALHEINTSIKDLEIAGPLDVEELVNSLTELLKNDPRVDQLKESLQEIAEQIGALGVAPLPVVPEQIGALVKQLHLVLSDLSRHEMGEGSDSSTEDLIARALVAIGETNQALSNLLTLESQCLLGYESVGEVGIFQSGERSVLTDDSEDLESQLKPIINLFERQLPYQVLLIGGVDSRPVTDPRPADRKLALDRAKWIQEKLMYELKSAGNGAAMSLAKSAIVVPTGPTTLKEVKEEDRTVEVRVCWSSNATKT